MKKYLHNASPTQAHALAGRVVSIMKSGGLRDRPTLNRLHEIVETRAYDPQGLKLFLKNFVDMFTAPAPPPQATQKQRRTYEEDRNQVLGGEQIVGMFGFEATPATSMGETFSLPAYEVDADTHIHEEDE